ncbi:non-ribosomal peptide synthetase [Pseudoalteromonas prydzensis]|uniref:non-ribosomal peptide synthetase n=1 Tax=Pseudoalteromonas prydzensis TaxID=182141 RepID=UPI0007E4E4E1|nr:non-ribosomal peptide synthetase [Pseudoalteromonas prydzensis]MBE0377183.1 arthrofactin-type cyclic lipopeptide synthetase C [Pseudoalteromonas prydzensis ACAM 620]
MNVLELLKTISDKNIDLRLEGDKLKIRGDKQALDAEIVAAIQKHKPQLVEYLSSQKEADDNVTARLSDSDKYNAFPLSYKQRRLWLSIQRDGDSPLNHHATCIHMRGQCDLKKLEIALLKLQQRHESLRTRFNSDDTEVWQQLVEVSSFNLPVQDFHEEKIADSELERIIASVSESPFDLNVDLLFKVTLIQLTNNEHILVLVTHSLIADAQSHPLLLRDLISIYQHESGENLPQLPELSLQFAEYVEWENRSLSSEKLNNDFEFWLKALKDVPQIHNLPTDYVRPIENRHRAAVITKPLPLSLMKRVEKAALDSECKPFEFMYTLFSVLLARISANTEVVVGINADNRVQGPFDDVIGQLSNTLIIRSQVNKSMHLTELLQQNREYFNAASGHQLLPNELLLSKLGVPQSLAANPLCQIFFSMSKAPLIQDEHNLLNAELIRPKSTITAYDLKLDISNRATDLNLVWEYNTDLFTESTIDNMADMYLYLMEAALQAPETSVWQLPLATEQLHPSVSVSDYPHCRLEQWFAEAAVATPEQFAIIEGKQRLTFSQLDRQSHKLAAFLQEQGIGSGERIGLCGNRSVEAIVGLLAILKSGAAYVPMEPSYPEARLRYVVENASVDLVLLTSEAVNTFPLSDVEILVLSGAEEKQWLEDYDNYELNCGQFSAEDPAYVIYTSGSTGQPKGVPVSHHNLVHYVSQLSQRYPFSPGLNYALTATLATDLGNTILFTSMVKSGCLHVINHNTAVDAKLMWEYFAQHDIDVAKFTPSHYSALIAEDGLPLLLPNKYLIFGGEVFSSALLRTIQSRCANTACRIINHYGPTETTIGCLTYEVNGNEKGCSIPVGQPLGNMAAIIMQDGQAVPCGVIGELVIAGPSVTSGYLNGGDEQVKYFQIALDNGQVLNAYRTGDQSVQDANGDITFIGRQDEQVRIRGFRVEIGEIENALLSIESVSQAAVLLHQDGDVSKLSAYVATVKSNEQIAKELKLLLLGHMLPDRIHVFKTLPLTANGKLDRRALSSLEGGDTVSYLAPSSKTEQGLQTIYQELLKLETVSANGDFFELGGHSLLTTRLLSRIRDSFNVDLTINDIFSCPVLNELAQLIDTQETSNYKNVLAVTSEVDEVPLSYAQQRLWFIEQYEGGSSHYNMPFAMRIDGRLNLSIAEQAFQLIIERHRALRTNFVKKNEGPVQLVNCNPEFELKVHDLGELQGGEQQKAIDALIAENTNYEFDLVLDLMIRASYIHTQEQCGILLVNLHHIASDGWSLSNLMNEFKEIYDALLIGREVNLPNLSVQYGDFAVWQTQKLQDSQSQKDYWLKQLNGLPQVHNLPLDRARPQKQTFAGSMHELVIDKERVDALQRLANSHDSTLFMVLHAAFSILLSGYSGQKDIVIGTPVANRLDSQLETLIGFFINTLLLRTQHQHGVSFRQLLQQIRSVNLDALENQDIPFEYLVEKINPVRSASHAPLCQIMMSMSNYDMPITRLENAELTPLPIEGLPSKFDLLLNGRDSEQGLSLTFLYNSDLFNAETIAGYAKSFELILHRIVADPDCSVDRLLIPDADEVVELIALNPAPQLQTVHPLIHQYVEAQALSNGESIALSTERAVMSYRQLNEAANQLAAEMIDRGIKAQALIGLSCERNCDMVVAMLAILKVGAAYVPLDPDYPSARIKDMVEDCDLAMIICHKAMLPIFAEFQTNCLAYDDEFVQQRLRDNAKGNIQHAELGCHTCAYVNFTSGSTGKPKGVMVPHRAIIRLVIDTNFIEFDAECCVAQTSNCSFDAATLEIWGALANGARLHFVSKEDMLDPNRLPSLISDASISTMFLTTSLFHQIANAMPTAFERLKYLVVGGEAIGVAAVNKVLKYGKPDHLLNGYGPTENTTFSAVFDIQIASEQAYPIGFPVRGTDCFILDDNRELLPRGAVGELYVGGLGVALGYISRPELTAERFFKDERLAPSYLYRTGDLVRWKYDGTLEYLGRIDHQVKIRGFRVELGEIETKLSLLELVNESHVMAISDASNTKRLVAYLTPSASFNLVEHEDFCQHVRAEISEILPDYMIPSQFVVMEQLPLNENGKVDRNKLIVPELMENPIDFKEPVGELEISIANIFCHLLKRASVSRHGNFFSLGGHSLLAVQLASELKLQLEKVVPIREIFSQPSVSQLAHWIENNQLKKALPAIKSIANKQAIPLSFEQNRLWFIDLVGAGSSQYNMPACFAIRGELNIDALQTAFDSIVEQHEILRTRYEENQGQYVQVVQAAKKVPLRIVDLSNLADEQRNTQLAASLIDAENEVFNLSVDLMIRVHLFKLAQDDHRLLINIHHIACDGWSMGILVKELNQLYSALNSDSQVVLKPLALQYADYSLWQKQHLTVDFLENQKRYWLARLADIPVVHSLPLDKVRPAQMTTTGHQFWQRFDKSKLDSLQNFADVNGVTLFMLLQSIYALTIGRWSRERDIVIGTPLAGRNDKALEDLVGCFVNTMVIRNNVDSSLTFNQFLAQNKDHILSDFDHQDVPFELLVEAINPPRSNSHLPIFQLWFVLQNMEVGQLAWPGLELTQLKPAGCNAKFDLMLSATEDEQGLDLHWVYNTALFEQQTIMTLADSFSHLVDEILINQDQCLNHYSLLNGKQQKVLLELRQKQQPKPATRTVVDNISAYALAYPEATAIEFGSESVSFAQLLKKSDRLAGLLRESGIGKGQAVGISSRRCLEQVISMVALGKLGAIFVPMDYKAPQDRLAFIIEDSEISAVLVSSVDAEHFDIADVEVFMLDGGAANDDWLAGYETLSSQTSEAIDSADTAYILYTSGTSGKPKGVRVSHVNLASLAESFSGLLKEQGLQQPYRWGWNAPLMFDASLQAYSQLGFGAQLVLIDDDTRVSPEAFVTLLDRNKIDIYDCTPAIAELLLNEAETRNVALPSMIVGGEAIHNELWQQIGLHCQKHKRFAINAYGPTETTINATCAVISPETTSNIGMPLSNTRIHVVDERGQLVPLGMVGECCIEGPSVSQGYLNLPELTKDKYSHIVLGNSERVRIYRSGDLVRWRPDHCLDYLGRIDHQVKLRGYRIELKEIEQNISELSGIEQAVVAVNQESQQLIAYLVVKESGLQVSDIDMHLRQCLPEYMIPEHYMYLDEIPVTSNGKVNIKALPSPEVNEQRQYTLPVTSIEQAVYDIWGRLLNVSSLSTDDNFFALGGHSLLAIRTISAFKESFSCAMTLKIFFEFPTIAAQARIISDLAGTFAAACVEICKAPESAQVPLSFAQQRMWLIDQMEEGSSHYNIPAAFHLQGDLNIDAVYSALQRIIERHEALRTVVVVGDNGPYQEVRSVNHVPIELKDLSKLKEDELASCLSTLIGLEAQAPFDLKNDLMLRVSLIKLSAKHHVMMFNMHHIASDGWSISVLVKEFTTLYSAYVKGEVAQLAELKASYRDYAYAQQLPEAKQKQDIESKYWLEQLSGIPQIHSLPLDKIRPARQTYQGALIERRVNRETLSRLNEFSKQYDVTLFMTLQAVLAVLLARWSNEQDIVIGTPVAGRTEQALEPMIGFFLNTLVMRNDLSENPKFSDFLQATKDMVLSAFDHQDYPFELLVEQLKPERSASHLPIFQIMFVLQNHHQETLKLPGVELTPAERGEIVAKFDLLLAAMEEDGELLLSWDYNSDLFVESSIARLSDGFVCLLDNILSEPDTHVQGMNLLPATERQKMLVNWNDTLELFPQDKLMHQLFIEQVSKTPTAIAVVDSEGELSYLELYQAARAINEKIAAHGFTVESLIAVRLPKGRQQLIATLAIMMSGSAYLPLDSNWPAERCNQIMQHAQAVMVLTDGQTQDELLESVPQLNVTQALKDNIYVLADAKNFVYRQQPDNLAYVIFTSGSTGKPKGVAIEHRSVVNTLFDINKRFNVSSKDKVLTVSALSFDLSVYDLFGLLAVGGSVVFPDEAREKDPRHWLTMVEQHGVTIWNTVPVSAELLVSEYEYAEQAQSSIRLVMMSGDWIPPGLPQRLWNRFSDCEVYSLGGATEGSIWSIMYPIIEDSSHLKSIPYGKPMANQKFFILTSDLEPCPVGVMGELHIGGVGVARCYYHDRERTDASYIQHPELKERLYKTGDMGRFMEDGNIEFAGRIDHQVKIRGFRIELGEIEAVLSDHQDINDAIVMVRQDHRQVQQLVAYLVVNNKSGISNTDSQRIRSYLLSKLPSYMVPSKFILLDNLPLSANGKVDRNRLPEPSWDSGSRQISPPKTKTEKLMAEVWGAILEQESIGVETNFFELGGSSVHLIQVVAKINALMGTDFSVVSLFEHSTVREMARFIDESQSGQERKNSATKSKRVNKLAQRRVQRVH